MDRKPRRERLPLRSATVSTRVGVAALRDLALEDVDTIARYWFESGDQHLDFLGIDRSLLGTVEDTRERFRRAIPREDRDQKSVALAITVDESFAGYTLLNRYTLTSNYSHWHITNPALRASGLSTSLYPHRIKAYFDMVPMDQLIHQTRTRNVGVNRMLDRYVPIAETMHVEHPDGVALPGEFHLRYVVRGEVPRLFERHASLGLSLFAGETVT